MSLLKNLQPQAVFHYFEELCAIPHGSGNTKGVSDYCVRFAKAHGLACMQDAMGNIIIKKAATAGYESSPAVMLQGHLDMVAVQDKGVSYTNMETDGLELVIDGDVLHANGTTLGGDDGIAVAYGLAILAANDLAHPRLEVVFTVDEEIGLLGAAGIDLSDTESKLLLNLDSEDEGIFLTSCAGGATVTVTLPVVREAANGVPMTLAVSGLRGGHSGGEIDKGRGNATKLLARLLYALSSACPIALLDFVGGTKDNAIPLAAEAVVLVAAADVETVQRVANTFNGVFQNEFALTDAGVHLTAIAGEARAGQVLNGVTTKAVIGLVNSLPNGIQAMSAAIPGLVETSLNLGVLKLEAERLQFHCSVRSAVQSRKEAIIAKLSCLVGLVGGTLVAQGDYPAWEYRAESRLRQVASEAYEALYGELPQIQAIHAGLECGFFAGKIADLDCIALGPQMYDIHTTQERMLISSVERTWKLVLELLRRLK